MQVKIKIRIELESIIKQFIFISFFLAIIYDKPLRRSAPFLFLLQWHQPLSHFYQPKYCTIFQTFISNPLAYSYSNFRHLLSTFLFFEIFIFDIFTFDIFAFRHFYFRHFYVDVIQENRSFIWNWKKFFKILLK